MTESEYIDYLQNIKEFLEGDKSYPFSAECYADTIINQIINHRRN